MPFISKVFFFFFIGLPFFSTALTVEGVLKKMHQSYSNEKKLSYTSTYELYKGHKSTKVHSSYKGFVLKQSNLIYQKINDTEFVYGADFFLKINQTERAMVLDKAQKNVQLDVDLESSLKHCSEKTIEKKDGYYSIKLVIKPTSEIPFSVLFLRIDVKTYFIEQLDIFYSNLEDFSNETNTKDEARPHLKIRFSDFNTNPKIKQGVFALSTYLKKVNDFLKPTGVYSEYELIDNRI